MSEVLASAPSQSAAAAQRQDWAADLGAALGRETAERAPLAELLDKSLALQPLSAKG